MDENEWREICSECRYWDTAVCKQCITEDCDVPSDFERRIK